MPLIKRGFMDYYKINKRGQITIPKYICDKLGWTTDIPLDICLFEEKIIVKPVKICPGCLKPLPTELLERGTCIDCPPPKEFIIY